MIKEMKLDTMSLRNPHELSNAIFQKSYGIDFMIMFGSFGKDHTVLSDIDIAYKSKERLHFKKDIDFHYEICRFLGTPEVDLVDLDAVPLVSQYTIISSGEVIYIADDASLADFREQVYNRYLDFEWMARQYRNEFLHSFATA